MKLVKTEITITTKGKGQFQTVKHTYTADTETKPTLRAGLITATVIFVLLTALGLVLMR